MIECDRERLEHAFQTALSALLAERSPEGHWVGELSTSALSTATAVSALALVRKATGQDSLAPFIAGGVAWLAAHQNDDGGWGDTLRSFSNISTTMLCRAALHLTGATQEYGECLHRAEAWLHARYGRTPEELAEAVRARYGTDRTFSVPILRTAALAGLVMWQEVPPLPFELACLPQSWFRFLQLPVVSYALPALIAIGQAVYHHRPPRNPLTHLLRRLAIRKSLRVLQAIQPPNGGFLEAAPLTSFVTLGLASVGQALHPVARKCVEFLVHSVRPDGSWPIDTNLSTWVTTLSVNALAAAGELEKLDRQDELCRFLLMQQYRDRHPYTGAAPGAWAWTPLPGGVPDADDTAGAILALCHFPTLFHVGYGYDLRRGAEWLGNLQNRDGGIPTFCRGWGKLPFDRSGPDLTAHALRAWQAIGWTETATRRALAYLARQQRADGSWLPLWFGNQHVADDENSTYGTARVLAAYRDLRMMTSEPARRGVAWLLSVQNPDGGWGGAAGAPSGIEETSLAVEVLLTADGAGTAVNKGLAWLVEQVEGGGLSHPTPIGFYFARLWYFEKLYPIIFTVAALGRARKVLSPAERTTP
jgi:squalene-hopene/tetraprenyl-beta-curcumene cyclase